MSLSREKYLDMETDCTNEKALTDFFNYYLFVINVDNFKWDGMVEGADPYGASNN